MISEKDHLVQLVMQGYPKFLTLSPRAGIPSDAPLGSLGGDSYGTRPQIILTHCAVV
jgi:hypothetical protein